MRGCCSLLWSLLLLLLCINTRWLTVLLLLQCNIDDSEPVPVFFKTEGDLVRHLVEKHGACAGDAGFWRCPLVECGAVVAPTSVAKHIRRQHPGHANAIPPGRRFDSSQHEADLFRCLEVPMPLVLHDHWMEVRPMHKYVWSHALHTVSRG